MIQITQRPESSPRKLFTVVRDAHGEEMWLRDISASGMRCEASRARRPGEYLDLEFMLPHQPSMLTLRGQVVTAAEGTYGGHLLGIRFCTLNPQAERVIVEYLDEQRYPREGTQSSSRFLRAVEAMERPFAELLARARMDLEVRRQAPARQSTGSKGSGHRPLPISLSEAMTRVITKTHRPSRAHLSEESSKKRWAA